MSFSNDELHNPIASTVNEATENMTTADPAPLSTTTPPQETTSGVHAAYVPHDLKYSADFEDSLIQAVLHSSRDQTEDYGIRVLPEDSAETPENGRSVRLNDISAESLPNITEEELPLPLDDKRRTFASPIPGVKLTHPGGYLEGGPGLDPDMDTFPDDFLSNNPHVSNIEQLRLAVQKEIEVSVDVLKERLRERQKAKERNEQIEKEIKTLTDQHSMELKIQKRMQEERAEKKEARERRKREKEGGG